MGVIKMRKNGLKTQKIHGINNIKNGGRMEQFGLNLENPRCTIAEWKACFEAKVVGGEAGAKMLSEFYAPRVKAMFNSDELLDFEKEPEYTLEEYLRLEQKLKL
jgi:hypothetical protein